MRCATQGIGHHGVPPHERELRLIADRDQEEEFIITAAVIEKRDRTFLQVDCQTETLLRGSFEIDLPDNHPKVREWPVGQMQTGIGNLLEGTLEQGFSTKRPIPYVLMRTAGWVVGEHDETQELHVPGIILWIEEVDAISANVASEP